jgi:hypothetical protein
MRYPLEERGCSVRKTRIARAHAHGQMMKLVGMVKLIWSVSPKTK